MARNIREMTLKRNPHRFYGEIVVDGNATTAYIHHAPQYHFFINDKERDNKPQ